VTPLLSSTLLRTQSDARLLALASRGYERAFETIVERYRRPLHRWCRQFLPEARAEDAVQTAFLKAWSSLRAGTQVSDLKPWLYRIARNAALDNARKAGYDYEELTEALRLAPAPETALERRRVMRETLTGMAGLPANQREALLRTAAGHSRAEIARELEVSEGAVRQLVHRARTTLRAAATALTPLPLASWAAAMGAEAGAPTAQRIAELAAGAGSAGIASAAIKTGTVVVAAGVLVAGPGGDLRDDVSRDSSAAASSAQPSPEHQGARGHDPARGDPGGRIGRGRDAGNGRSHRGLGGSGSGTSGAGRSGGDDGHGDVHSGSSGSGERGDDDRSATSGSGRSGGGGDDDFIISGATGTGTSGSGTSGSGTSGSGTSGSGTSGSGTSGSGSELESSGSGSGLTTTIGSSGPGSGTLPDD
jgi:RNA polymerase sigma factor (sigma-70 family)